MIFSAMRFFTNFCKSSLFLCGAILVMAGCSVNPATGEKQFTALMPPSQEVQIGAQEHEKIQALYGALPDNDPLASYVNDIGQRITKNTERPDIDYKFFVLDSPMVNAFAVPGGYIYVTRGLVAQANSEAELAAVIAHEIGHITGRHSAERYSQSVLTNLGGALLSAALDSPAASQAIGLGSNLYLSSYSRGQESQADELGIRYLHRAGYDPDGMAWFLSNLEAQSALEARLNGQTGSGGAADFFATHPRTSDRVAQARALAAQSPPNDAVVRREAYLQKLDGLTYGDSARHGFVRGSDFYHPQIGMTFSVPEGYRIVNQPQQVVATAKNGAVLIFDSAANPQNYDPLTYLTRIWMQDEELQNPERIEINNMAAATASFPGRVNNTPVTIRLVAVQWAPGTFFRFQLAIPQNLAAGEVTALQRATYSLRRMSAQEKAEIGPYKINVITAQAGDNVKALARSMPYDDLPAERFRTLNGMPPGQEVQTGRLYKLVTAAARR